MLRNSPLAMPLTGSNLPHSVVEEGIIHRVFPLTPNNRWYITNTNANYGNIKPESSENVNLVVACFK